MKSQQPVDLEHLNHVVALFISPIGRQLADAPLNSGITDGGWLEHLVIQQGTWLAEINDVGHQASPALSISLLNQIRS